VFGGWSPRLRKRTAAPSCAFASGFARAIRAPSARSIGCRALGFRADIVGSRRMAPVPAVATCRASGPAVRRLRRSLPGGPDWRGLPVVAVSFPAGA
jgi:hypothetical protein